MLDIQKEPPGNRGALLLMVMDTERRAPKGRHQPRMEIIAQMCGNVKDLGRKSTAQIFGVSWRFTFLGIVYRDKNPRYWAFLDKNGPKRVYFVP